MLVPRAVRLRNKGTDLHAPELGGDPPIAPPSPLKQDRKAGPPKCVYGNYKSYYGYRKEENSAGVREDPRMQHLKKEWFYGKRCLDIGCNSGRIFGYRSMLGVDIDGSLIRKAESIRQSIIAKNPERAEDKFPYNTTFKTENFVETTHAELYDTIICFSVTKWIQLNWGDDGIRKFFTNINACLRPGGFMLLEPQEFSSYKRRSRLTEQTQANYKSIKLKPQFFTEYLALEFGYEELKSDTVQAGQKGFARSIFLYRKPVTEFVKSREWVPPEPIVKGQASEKDANVETAPVDELLGKTLKKKGEGGLGQLAAPEGDGHTGEKKERRGRKRVKEAEPPPAAAAPEAKKKKKEKKQHKNARTPTEEDH